MIIRELYVKNFGRLKERHIPLEEGLNVIYGANESGKTTLHVFIQSIFYGIRRLRGRAAQSDRYSRYEPWENSSYYAGVLRFESGKKLFRLTRNFQKNQIAAELICETDGEKLSVEQGDLDMLLGNVSERVFESTMAVRALKEGADENLISALRNYMVNYQEGSLGELDLEETSSSLRGLRRELERQKKEEGQELQVAIRELQSKLSYLEQERKDIEEKIKSQKAYKEAATRTDFGKKRKRIIAGSLVAGLAIAGAGIIGEFHPAVLVLLILFGGVTIFSALFLWLRLKKQESEERKIYDKKCWELERFKELQIEKDREIENLYSEFLELKEQESKRHPLQDDIEAVTLALQTIETLAREQHGTVGTQLQSRTSEIFSALTDGKYQGIHLSETLEIHIDTGTAYVTPEQLSRGTLEQIYFAFRMAAGELLCQEEKLPIMLDDVFVMYDEKRLEQALRWLSKCGHQVLLFSCQKREKEILDAFGLSYHYVKLEESIC